MLLQTPRTLPTSEPTRASTAEAGCRRCGRTLPLLSTASTCHQSRIPLPFRPSCCSIGAAAGAEEIAEACTGLETPRRRATAVLHLAVARCMCSRARGWSMLQIDRLVARTALVTSNLIQNFLWRGSCAAIVPERAPDTARPNLGPGAGQSGPASATSTARAEGSCYREDEQDHSQAPRHTSRTVVDSLRASMLFERPLPPRVRRDVLGRCFRHRRRHRRPCRSRCRR
jgi:hypothetical protein